MVNKNIPTVLVIFGATGDLMTKKIIPALFHLSLKNKLPKLFQIIGFSRRNLSNETFRGHILEILKKYYDREVEEKDAQNFINLFDYHRGDFNQRSDYHGLAKVLGQIDGEWKACSNKLFYLAVPPQNYKTIFKNLASSGLTIPCGPDEGWTRVLVEKPFGHDAYTAEDLDLLLAKLFKEEQIYRIDHYLAKEMLQNILSFRFSNNLLEQNWNNKFIEKIEIKLLEKIGVERRGTFYDGLGALRDVGQNHLLQMLALVTMDQPASFAADAIRSKRAQILRTLRKPDLDEIKNHSFRAQYKGYKDIKGVHKDSKTETYFKVRAFLDSPRWQGVPIILESGKKFKDQIKEIKITFKHTTPCLCPPGIPEHYKNKIIFQLEPQEKIKIYFLAKKPGLEMQVENREFDFTYRNRSEKIQYVEEYEKLLLDCIEGNQLLFLSTKEVAAMWSYIDPYIKAWDKDEVPLHFYTPETNDILHESMFINEKIKTVFNLKKEIGIFGLGKMGGNIARQLLEKGWKVAGYNRTAEDTRALEKEGLTGAYSIEEFVNKLKKPKVVWLTLPAGQAIDDVLFEKNGLVSYLEKGDILIEAGNSYYKDSLRRAKKLFKQGINFIDAGVSGGPAGARYGACLMVGGERRLFEYLLPVFLDVSVAEGVQFFEGVGAGHFVKMVHNGIEYGMMQALAEGFAILKNSHYKLDLTKATQIYNHGSVIESRLVGWLKDAFHAFGEDLKNVSGSVAHTGEGAWTVKTASEMKIKAKVIADALKFRIQSVKNPSYTGKLLSALRNRFGWHSAK